MFYHIVISSYLLLPLSLVFIKNKKNLIVLSLVAYSLISFTFLLLFETSVPVGWRKYYYAAYTSFEYLAFAYLFWESISTKLYRKLIVSFSIAFIIFEIVYLFLTINVRFKLDSVPVGIETILVFVYIVFFFYEFFKKFTGDYIYNHYCFWLAVGILLYLGGSFFFYILINHLSKEQIEAFGYLTYVVEILKNLLFVTALFVYEKNPSYTEKNKIVEIPHLDLI